MPETTTLIGAITKGAAKIFAHFKDQYGSMYFTPIGVNEKTPAEIAPNVAQCMQQHMFSVQGQNVQLFITDETVGLVFDGFVEGFYNSLNLLGKGAMKMTGLKMTWNEFLEGLNKRKAAEDKTSYNTWKNNFSYVLENIFVEIIADFQAQGRGVILTNGQQGFPKAIDAINALNSLQQDITKFVSVIQRYKKETQFLSFFFILLILNFLYYF